ncbi:hypothetical protein BJ508DRAFT_66125 [Ascobolus immersus RN42]|uniref:C2H2-type domain-containing protein n=1 Tax=Ascobolus immersus RN42 TaxID=1160509 RepID=A0A3N4IBJ8_ASCIM|nr:hypothetical protein BJ508DRAFT_66125 [Ascobolus immersus RN42]
MEGATKEPRQFQFPLVGRDEEEMEERRRILGINTSAEAPAIAPTGKGLTTIPVEGPEFPEANTAHAIDTAPLIFSPFHAFQDEDIISLMEASSSSLSGRGRSPSPEFPNFDWDSLFASAQPDVSVPIAGCSATKSSEMHLSAQGITRKYDATAVVVNLETPHAGSPHQVSRHLEVATVERVKIGRGRRKTSPAKTGQQKTAQSTVHQGKGKTGNGNKPFICTLPECPKDFASARKTDLLRHLREYHEMFLFVCVNPHCRSLGYDNQKKKHRTARALRAKGHVVHCYEGAIEADNWLTVVERIKGKGFKLLPLVPVEYREAILNGFSGDND